MLPTLEPEATCSKKVDTMVQVIMCISKALVGAQLRWSVREKECYGIFYCFKVLEDMLKHVKFHLKTDHKNLVYINCALTGKVARWKLYMQDWNFTVSWVEGQEEHQQVPDKLSRLVSNPEETEASIDTETAILAVAVAQVAISDAEYAIISSQHNAIRGHSGVDVTLNRLRNGGYTFPNLELKVRTFIRKCPLCQLTSQIKPLVKAQKFTTAALYPFQVICADHIGPLPKDEEGYQYVLVVICAFSRWIELFPTKTTTAEETARCIHQHFGRWGTADRLRTDNGPAFANDLLKGLANLLGSTNEFTTAYSSEENGIVERANKEVLRHLRALVFETRVKDQWSFKDLPIIQRIFNTQEKSSTGVSPADLVLTNAIHMQTNLYSPTDSAKAIETSTPIREVLDKMIARQSTLLKVAQKTQSALDSHRIALHDPNYTDYPINSYVLYTAPTGPSDKLELKHRGPYQVVNKLDSIYTIQDLVDGKFITTHINNLREFHYDPERTNPIDIAVQNRGEFFIDSILEHRGDRQRRSTMEFKVRWLGYGPEHDSWEPYKNLAHTEQLILYLVRNRMRSLIPKGH